MENFICFFEKLTHSGLYQKYVKQVNTSKRGCSLGLKCAFIFLQCPGNDEILTHFAVVCSNFWLWKPGSQFCYLFVMRREIEPGGKQFWDEQRILEPWVKATLIFKTLTILPYSFARQEHTQQPRWKAGCHQVWLQHQNLQAQCWNPISFYIFISISTVCDCL